MDFADWAGHSDYLWLAAAVAFMALEVLTLSFGLMFAGLGAVVVGALIYTGMVAPAAYVTQCAIFFVATAMWSALLWAPLKKMRAGKKASRFNNIVGDIAHVGSNGISRSHGGEVTWSGTIMRAELAQGAADHVEAGAQVEIVDVRGATLVVKAAR
jgi:membrane protein implicated in regulation of membrane protease activity